MFWKYAKQLQENTHVAKQPYWNHTPTWVLSCALPNDNGFILDDFFIIVIKCSQKFHYPFFMLLAFYFHFIIFVGTVTENIA